MSKRILLAGILAGVALFFWEFAAHMALPLGEAGMSVLPNEAAVLAAFKEVKQDGLYFFPGGGWRSDMTSAEKQQAMEKSHGHDGLGQPRRAHRPAPERHGGDDAAGSWGRSSPRTLRRCCWRRS